MFNDIPDDTFVSLTDYQWTQIICYPNAFTNFTCDATTTSFFVEFLLIHTMVTPVFITQIEDEEHSVLSEQIHSLNLKDTTSVSTMATNTYIPKEKAPFTVTAFSKKMATTSSLYQCIRPRQSVPLLKQGDPFQKIQHLCRAWHQTRIILLRCL